MKISVIVPVYNEEENIAECCEEITSAVNAARLDYEIVLVDDGSVDNSFTVMAAQAAINPRIKVIRFRRNFGQTAAMAAGFKHASGEIVVPIDGDLQNDPRDIPDLIEKINSGYDVVSGWRKHRKDKLLTRRFPSVVANWVISRLTGVVLHDYGCTLKAYRREILEEIHLYGELHRFVPALAHQYGARVTEVSVNHRPRRSGTSKYGMDRTLRVVLDLITVRFLLQYRTRPLQLFGKWGVMSLFLGFATGLAVLYMKFFDGLSMNRNPLLILTAFLLFSGVQFFALGLLGELVTRTYHETQGKPVYSTKDKLNFD